MNCSPLPVVIDFGSIASICAAAAVNADNKSNTVNTAERILFLLENRQTDIENRLTFVIRRADARRCNFLRGLRFETRRTIGSVLAPRRDLHHGDVLRCRLAEPTSVNAERTPAARRLFSGSAPKPRGGPAA